MDEDVALEIDPLLFRQVLGHFPTGVTVVAAVDDEQPVRLTVGSFFSISLDPPLVGFCIAVTSTTWPAIERSGIFAVSFLADDQIDVCKTLATKDLDKFSGLSWSPAPVTGAPLIDQAVAHIDCDLDARHSAGDHWIVVGKVRHLALHRGEAGPLTFLKGGFGRHEAL